MKIIEGRANRLDYLKWVVTALFIMIIWGITLSIVQNQTVLMTLGTLVFISINAGYIIFTIKRLHDMNISGWWVLCWIIPVINIGLLLLCIFKQGTEGENNYGN